MDKVSAQPLPYPFWHHAKAANDRLGPPISHCWPVTIKG